jgi:hypothetical protein
MKKRTKIFIIIFIVIINSTFCLSAQNKKEQSFKKTLNDVVLLLIKKDSVGLLKYVDKNTGVFLIYRPGTMDTYSNVKALCFKEEIFPTISVASDIKAKIIKYTKTLPEFSCENERWSKAGCFVDTTKIDHMLSNTAKSMVEYMGMMISEKTITDLNELEMKSRRIVIVAPGGNSLVLYLGYFNQKWYLTIIDLVSGDCSA